MAIIRFNTVAVYGHSQSPISWYSPIIPSYQTYTGDSL